MERDIILKGTCKSWNICPIFPWRHKCFIFIGQVSCALTLYVSQLIGINISPYMVEVYNTCESMQGLKPHEMRAVSSIAEVQQ